MQTVTDFYQDQSIAFRAMFFPLTSCTFGCEDKHYEGNYYMQDCLAIWGGMPGIELTEDQKNYELKLNNRKRKRNDSKRSNS